MIFLNFRAGRTRKRESLWDIWYAPIVRTFRGWIVALLVFLVANPNSLAVILPIQCCFIYFPGGVENKWTTAVHHIVLRKYDSGKGLTNGRNVQAVRLFFATEKCSPLQFIVLITFMNIIHRRSVGNTGHDVWNTIRKESSYRPNIMLSLLHRTNAKAQQKRAPSFVLSRLRQFSSHMNCVFMGRS